MAYTIDEFLYRFAESKQVNSSAESRQATKLLPIFKDKFIYLNPANIELSLDLIGQEYKVAFSDAVGFGHCFIADFEIGKLQPNVTDYIRSQPFERFINFQKHYSEKEWDTVIAAVKSTANTIYSALNINNCVFADSSLKYIFVNRDDFTLISERFKGDMKFSITESKDSFQVTDILSLTTKIIKKSEHLPRGFTLSHHSLIEPKVEDVPKMFGKVYSLYGNNSDFKKIETDYHAAMAVKSSNPTNQISTSISKDLLNGILSRKSGIDSGTVTSKATFSPTEFMSKNLEFSECCLLFSTCATHCRKIITGNNPYPFFQSELDAGLEPLSSIMKAFDSVLLTQSSRAYKTTCSIWLEEMYRVLKKASHAEFQQCMAFVRNFIHDTLMNPGPITKEMIDKIYLTLTSGTSGSEKISVTVPGTLDSKKLQDEVASNVSTSLKLESQSAQASTKVNLLGLDGKSSNEKMYDLNWLTKSIQQEEDAHFLGKLDESIKASKAEKKVQEKDMTKLSLVQDAKATYDKAKFRVAQRQIVRRVRDAIIMGLNALGGDRSEIKAIEKALKTNIGEGGLALLIGFVAHRSDFMSQHPGVVKIIEEMKVEGMAQIGDDIIETIAGQVMPLVMSVVDSSIAAIPEVHIEVKEKPNKRVRIRKPKVEADDDETEVEHSVVEQALKEEQKQAVAVAK